jgi:hypothetical protein
VDDTAVAWIARFMDQARAAERHLMPRRLQRALEQLHEVAGAWAISAGRAGDEPTAAMWRTLAALTARDPAGDGGEPGDEIDPYALAQRWIDLVRPRLDARRQRSRRRYQLLSDITADLVDDPVAPDEVRRALADLPMRPPLTDRITAAIVGVPGPDAPDAPGPRPARFSTGGASS